MTDRQAGLLALRLVRNSPSHVLSIITRYVGRKIEDRKFPYYLEPGQTLHIYDALRVEQDLKILLLYSGIEYYPLQVRISVGEIKVSFKGIDGDDYLASMNQQEAIRVVYGT